MNIELRKKIKQNWDNIIKPIDSLGDFEDLVAELCLVGGFLIASTGLSILNIKNLKSLNMLPSLAVPIIFILIRRLVMGI